MFYLFIKACEVYRFRFALSTYTYDTSVQFRLILRPNGTFYNIDIIEYTYTKLFFNAIKEMIIYRKEKWR